ncbi:MAG: ABC transporter substrate-binding protein [Sphingomonadaceae bacterium]
MAFVRFALLAAGVTVLAFPSSGFTQSPDAAIAPVAALNGALIASMKGGKRLGFQGRVTLLKPVVARSFDLPLMTRLIVGPSWTQMSAADQATIVSAFSRFTVAQYANNFNEFGGQSFTVDPKVETRGTDRLVRTSINQVGKPPIPIGYRLRGAGGQWQIVDVFYNNAISQLATRRADFATTLAKQGPKALAGHLDTLTARLAN